jgi:hypothetical protein
MPLVVEQQAQCRAMSLYTAAAGCQSISLLLPAGSPIEDERKVGRFL